LLKTTPNPLTINTCTKSQQDHFLVVYFGKGVRKKTPFSYKTSASIPLTAKAITSNLKKNPSYIIPFVDFCLLLLVFLCMVLPENLPCYSQR